MKLVTAFIQPLRLAHVREALLAADVGSMIVTVCCGHGRDTVFVPSLRYGPDVPDLFPNAKIEVIVQTSACETAIEAIIRGARMGKHGDGKILISEIESVVNIGSRISVDGVRRISSIVEPAAAAGSI